jgi:hypothetical protein
LTGDVTAAFAASRSRQHVAELLDAVRHIWNGNREPAPRANGVQCRVLAAVVVRHDERQGFVQIRIREQHLARPRSRNDHARHDEVAVPLGKLRRQAISTDVSKETARL